MKKSFSIKCILFILASLVLASNIQIISGQTNEDQATPIPENINKIFKSLCMQCHGSEGKLMARTKLDFSKWTEYGAAKEAEKATDICSEITGGLMPPKSTRNSNPELIPTKEQIGLICKWAESYKSKETGQ